MSERRTENSIGAFVEAVDAVDDVLVIRPEILATPIGELAVLIANDIVTEVYGSNSAMASPIIGIIITLLPALLEALQACNAEPKFLLAALRTKRPIMRQRYENHTAFWAVRSLGKAMYREIGGKKIGPIVMDVLGNPDNEVLLREALTTPPPAPIWEAFNA